MYTIMNDEYSTPKLRIADVQVALDLRPDREEGVAVDVVQQVHAEQDRRAANDLTWIEGRIPLFCSPTGRLNS